PKATETEVDEYLANNPVEAKGDQSEEGEANKQEVNPEASDEEVNNKEVEVKDAVLKNILKRKLGVISSKNLTVKDLEKITTLDNLYGVKDLSALKYATNLTSLEINGEYNEINDISALRNLTKLENLSLENTKIKDISAISNLINLRDLNISGPFVDPEYSDVMVNPADYIIKNIEALKNLKNLETLSLANRGVSDISTLANLTNLNDVVLSNNNISDISVLKNLKNISSLDLTSNKNIENTDSLKELTSLTNLWLTENKITNIEALKELTNLKKLYLNVNKISDLSPLVNLTNLTHLSLGANELTDISSLGSLKNLVSLRAADNKITDVSSLTNLVNLTDLNLSNNSIHDFSPLNSLEKINKRRGFAKQIENIEVTTNEITLPTAKTFDGSEIGLEKNEDGSLVLYEVEYKKGKNQPKVNDETEELTQKEKQYKIIEKDGKYILPANIENGLYAVQWFKNYQQWGVFILNINLPEKLPTDKVELTATEKVVYRNLLNDWSNFNKKYKNLTDEANNNYVENGKPSGVPKPTSEQDFTREDFSKLRVFDNNGEVRIGNTPVATSVNNELVKLLENAANLEEFKVLAKKDGVRNITDFSFLNSLEKLKIFYYTNQNKTDERVAISNIDLTANTNLEDVRIGQGDLTNLNFVRGLNLKNLDVEDNNINDINAISEMTSLKELHLDNNKLTNENMSALTKLVNLETLYLKNNKNISDINSLAALKNLEALELKHISVKNLTVLKELPNLRRLVIDGNPLAENYMEIIKELDLNTAYLGEISKDDFEWLKTYAIRGASTANLNENKQREFTFTKLPITVEVKKSQIKDGKVTIENPLKDWDDMGAGLDYEKDAPEDLEVPEDDATNITINIGDKTNKVIKYDINIEDYNNEFEGRPANIHGTVELTINVVDDTVEEKVVLTTHGDFINISNNEGNSTFNKNESAEIILTPDEKRYPMSFKVNGQEKVNELAKNNNVYTYSFNIENNTDIRVIYQETRKLTFEGDGLSVVGKDITKLNHGEEVVVQITPPSGKVISKFTETNYNSQGEISRTGNNNTNKLPLVNDNKYTINNLDYDTVLHVEYEDKPTTPNPESEFTFDENSGTITNYSYSGRKDVIIPDEINGIRVEHIADAFAYAGIDSVVLPKYLKSIGDQAFQANNLKEVIIPEGVETIGIMAFNGNKISKLVLPSTLKTIGRQAFRTNSLTNVTIPESVKVLEKEVFANNKLENVTLSNEVVLKGGGIFLNNKLTSFEIPTVNTEIPEKTFEGNNLREISIPNGITKIGERAFFNNNLTSVNISETVKNIENLAFANNNLTSVVLGAETIVHPTSFDDNVETNLPKKEIEVADESDFEFNVETKTIISYNGTSPIVKIPETINGVAVEHIGYKESGFGYFKVKLGAFEYNAEEGKTNKLYKVILPSTLKSIDDNAFKDNDLKEISLSEGLENIGVSAFENNKLSNVILPSSLKTLEEYSFKGNEIAEINLENVTRLEKGVLANNKLSRVELNSNLEKISDELFENNRLEEINLPANISSVGINSFSNNKLTSLVLPNSVTLISDGAFSNNQISSNLEIPESVTNIGKNSFLGNDIGKLTVLGGAEIKSRAFYRAGVTDVSFNENVNISGSEAFGFNPLVNVSIPKSTISLGAYAFERNILESVELPSTLVEIKDGAFEVNNIREILIPSSVTTIGNAAFFNNELDRITLQDGLVTIGEGAFQKNKLTEVTIPNSVTEIKRGAFTENNITRVTISDGTVNNDGFDSNKVL
ncbi:leucine-rich repeat protein, partial [Gemella cuniculi]|uniref:leucine-rich repeat protein n=1 Tax=Gemella cuniculi TaxID=150240 RepID=UPI000687CA4A